MGGESYLGEALMYVFVSTQCMENARRLEIVSRVDELVTRLRAMPLIEETELFFDTIGKYRKRSITSALRMFAVIREIEPGPGVGRLPVLCLLDVMRHEPYMEISASLRHGADQLDALAPIGEVRAWLVQELARADAEARAALRRPRLPDELVPWTEPFEDDFSDHVVYDGPDWVAAFRQPEYHTLWASFHRLIMKIVGGPINDELLIGEGPLRLIVDGSRGVLFRRFHVRSPRERHVLFLVAPLRDHALSEQAKELAHRLAEGPAAGLLQLGECDLLLDDLAPYARRAYPDLVLANDEAWHGIQQNEASNLSLSAEEETILASCTGRGEGSSRLPVFINGGAGSGKSTLLQHLFALVLYRTFKRSLSGTPIFLSYSRRLVEASRSAVSELLQSHARFLIERNPGEPERFPPLDSFFRPFQEVLFECLPAEERGDFPSAMHVSFDVFKQLYTGRCREASMARHALKLQVRDEFSPETAWHVIRSFIKGRADSFTEPDDYADGDAVARRDRTVPADTYRRIYDTIWSQWYCRLRDEGYWDDQDLVRRIVEQGYATPRATAVFCDEAQDLTRLELQVLLRLSHLAHYELPDDDGLSLPFAFAGDPFQTLNPTGFRWASLEAMLHESVRVLVPKGRRVPVKFTPKTLEYNYRSTPPVAQASNLLQLARHVLFNERDLAAQKTWHRGESFPEPNFRILGEDLDECEFARCTGNTIILVPEEPGREADFVRSDDVLRSFIVLDPENPPKNVLSPASAKGLEFNRVVLYKFGERCSPDAFASGDDEGADFSVRHFFNNLYVAASRAQWHLFVVDTPHGLERLWSRLDGWDDIETLLEGARKNQLEWHKHVRPIVRAPAGSAAELAEEDPLANAVEMERAGMSGTGTLRVDNLRRAAQFYAAASKGADAQRCVAHALWSEGRYSEAGRRFMGQGDTKNARRAWWQGACWSELQDFFGQRPMMKAEPEAKATSFISEKRPAPETLERFGDDLVIWLRDGKREPDDRKSWELVVREFVARVDGLLNGSARLSASQWVPLGRILADLAGIVIPELHAKAAECFSRGELFSRATESWERAGLTNSLDYRRAKAEVLGFPDGLPFLEGQDDLILRKWEAAGRPDKAHDRQWLIQVAPTLRRRERHAEALLLFVALNQPDEAKTCYQAAFGKGQPKEHERDILIAWLRYLLSQEQWIDALDVLDGPLAKLRFPAAVLRPLEIEFVRAIAHSSLRLSSIAAGSEQLVALITRVSEYKSNPAYSCPSSEETSAAYERVGSIREALAWYERLAQSGGSQRIFAAQRWVVVKRREIEALKSRRREIIGESDPAASRAERDLTEFMASAGIPRDAKLPEFPEFTRDRVRVLPAGHPVERLAEGDLRLHVGALEVRTYRAVRRVQISDPRTGDAVKVDFERGTANGDTTATVNPQGNIVRFQVSAFQCDGEWHVSDEADTVEVRQGVTTVKLIMAR